MNFFATAAKGTEPALRDELRELGFRRVRADRGGVHFEGPIEEGFRACIELRTAVRVLMLLSRFEAPSGDALYEGARAVDWQPYLDSRRTLAVRAFCRSSVLTHTQFIAQKTKDAVVDQLRERLGARPSVDLEDPDVSLFVHLVRDQASLYVDLSGQSLHQRGYRRLAGEAPLKETLAAAILRLSGWDRERPLVDPMCGSGTIPIEAALWARNVAPGLFQERHGFERWVCHDASLASKAAAIREAARAKIVSDAPPILAGDIEPAALQATRDNARAAGVTLHVERRALRDLAPTRPPGYLVTNPPYGERLPAAPAVYKELGLALARLRGHSVSILAGTPEIARAIPFRPARALVVFNGAIECRLLTYEIR
jgi:putative N6-adenine-specific DNA methylase